MAVCARRGFASQFRKAKMEARMTRSLILAATALALSTVAASAQAVYMAPGYGYTYGYYAAPAYAVPTYAAPYGYVAAPVFAAPSAPLYNYAPGYTATYSVTDPDWDW
jgi:hypothetical protein